MTLTEQIIKEAYKLYMPQVEEEITELANFLLHEHDLTSFIEIGTKFGGTFQVFNEICDFNTRQHNLHDGYEYVGPRISIDLPEGIHGGVSLDECAKRDIIFYAKYRGVEMISGDSHSDDTLRKVQGLLGYNKVDMLFIDGDHTYEGVKQDFEMYSKFVRKGGVVCFHDINDTDRHRARNVFVGKFWNEIKNSYIAKEINAFQDWAGIGLIFMS